MNKINLIALSIVAGLLLIASGGALGFFYKTQQVSPQLDVIKNLSSKIIPSMVAYGQVTEIEGRNITLSYGGDNIKINVEESSSVYLSINDSAGKPMQEKISFKDIKKGNNLSVAVKLLPNGQLQSQSIFVLLPVPKIK